VDVMTRREARAFGAPTDGLASPHQALGAISMILLSVFAVLVVLLHAIKPEFEPSWRFLSEYSIGRHGWVMMTAFFLWAISSIALSAALRPHVATRSGRAGCVLLSAVGLSLLMAGLFTQDPITAKPDALTTHGTLHAVASMIGIPGLPIAALLITWSLKRNPGWSTLVAGMSVTAHLTWFALLAMVVYLGSALPAAGGFGPGVYAGWMNRLVVCAYTSWQMAASYSVYRAGAPH
jgi:hypothetical protein